MFFFSYTTSGTTIGAEYYGDLICSGNVMRIEDNFERYSFFRLLKVGTFYLQHAPKLGYDENELGNRSFVDSTPKQPYP